MEEIDLDLMKEKIEQSGSKVIWTAIENLDNWKTRVAYRKAFFLAGGSLD